MLAMICHQPAWIKRAVTIVHGRDGKLSGWKPRRKRTLGLIKVTIKKMKFRAINAHIGVGLDLGELLYLIFFLSDHPGLPLP